MANDRHKTEKRKLMEFLIIYFLHTENLTVHFSVYIRCWWIYACFYFCSSSALVATFFFIYASLLRLGRLFVRMFSALPHNIATNHLIMRSRARTPFLLGKLRCTYRAIVRKKYRTQVIHPSPSALNMCWYRRSNTQRLSAVMNEKKKIAVLVFMPSKFVNGKPRKKALINTIQRQHISVIRSNFYSGVRSFSLLIFFPFSSVSSVVVNLYLQHKLFRIEAYRLYDWRMY